MSEPARLCEIKTPDFFFSDERGTITQLFRNGFRQANVVFTNKGQHRGRFHYHRENEELFYIAQGKVCVRLRLRERAETHVFGAGDMFQIHKDVRHDFEFLEDTLLLGFYDRGIETPAGGKDIYTDN